MRTVLIVDPDADSDTAYEALNRSGFLSVLIADAGSALSIVRSGMPLDLVITDLRLPDMDGFDFVSLLRIRRPGLPVLVLTANGSLESYLHAMHLGVADYIHKPVRIKELGRIVNALFHRSGACSEAVPPSAA